MTDLFAHKMRTTGIKLLWRQFLQPSALHGRCRDQSRPGGVRLCHGARVKSAIDTTHKLSSANYVLWGGREGYETLLNTNLFRELEQLGRFLSLVVDYKHEIGFKGVLLVEPKPQEREPNTRC